MLYKKYPKYKDSGIEWLGEIPEHWEVRKVKYIFKVGRGRIISQQELEDNGKYPVFSSQTENDGILGYINTFDYDYSQLTWTTDGVNAGTVFLRKGKYNCTNICGTLKPIKKENLNFLKYSLQYSTKFYKRPDTNGAKIMNNEMANIFIVYPPLPEQKVIATFLDIEIEKIDTLIKKEEELIKLLEEKKEALITKAVTKGLKNTKMKDSGIEWLGEIPEYWEVRRLKYVVKIINGSTPSSKIKEYWNGNIIWITPQDFGKNKYLQNSKRKITKLGLLNCGTEIVPKNSIILTTRAPIGNVAIAKHSLCTNQGCKSLIPLKITSNYLYYYFVSISSVLNALGIGTTFKELNTESLKNLSIPLPPLQEQKQIAEYLDKKLSQIDKLIKKSKKAIELLKEKKEALITNAVTGKIDVRNFDEA